MRSLALLPMLVLGLATTTALGDDPATSSQKNPPESTLGVKPPEGAVVLFDGEDLDGWLSQGGEKPAAWPVSGELFTVGPGQGSILTKQKFGDCRLHLEFNVPYMPDKTGQARGNSGVYVNGLYEVQVLDSYGLDPKNNDCGAVYQQIVPAVNACKPPLQWQSYDITFHKAKAEDGQVTKKARITVVQNGLTIIDDKEIDVTPGGVAGQKAGEDGPLLLQDHGNLVQYRNIWVVPLSD